MLKRICFAVLALLLLRGSVMGATSPALLEIQESLRKMPANSPRLLATEKNVRQLRENAATATGKMFAERILADADLLDRAAPLRWNPSKSTGQILGTSRAALYRLNTLGVAYWLTGKEKYALRGIREMEAVAAFPHWNPDHFLDTAEMTLAFAIGLDWFRPLLREPEREMFQKVLVEKGLRPSLRKTRKNSWVSGRNNWTQVCHAGMTAGALAVYDAEPELAATIIHRAVVNLPRVMDCSYGKGGSYPEGPTYWGYGTEFNMVLIALLEAATGGSFGLADHPGFRRTGEYITAMQTPTHSLYTYADSNSHEYLLTYAKLQWCGMFRRPDCFSLQDRRNLERFCRERNTDPERMGERLLPLALFGLSESMLQSGGTAPKSYFSGNEDATPVAVHRSGSGDEAAYLAIKGGRPDVNHGHMDSGSFLFEAGGVRWFDDLGAEGYGHFQRAGVNLWNSAQNSDRWRIFRYGVRSHSIFTIDEGEQNVRGKVSFLSFRGEGPEQESVLDLTPAWRPRVRKAVRKARLADGRTAEITDHLEGVAPKAQVTWQLCLRGMEEVSIRGKEVRLQKNGRHLLVRGVAPGEWSWQLYRASDLAVPLDTPEWRNSGKYLLGQKLDDVKILQFTPAVPSGGTLDISVTFSLQEK